MKRPLLILAAVLTLILPRLLPPDGHPHNGFEQFLGRLHPLSIHLPIALLLLMPILEIVGRNRPAFRETAAFLLPLAAFLCVVSTLLGVLHAHGGGFALDTVRTHMWSAIALTILALICTLLRPAWQTGSQPWLYPAALTVAVLLTFWTGHQGGSITYGRGYLTEFASSFLPKPRKTYPPVDPASAYATEIQPIFTANCVSCHGAAKRKGGLQLDTYAHLMDGGNSGVAVVEEHPERSILLERVTLPPSDRKFMPSEGKPPLTPRDIDLIRTWIQSGASPLVATSKQ